MTARGIFLTGATGLLGRYLLRDLLLGGHRLIVLARPQQGEGGPERVAELLNFWRETLQVRLPDPITLEGDLGSPSLGLDRSDRSWLARRARAVVHTAASVRFHNADGEPWRTNVEGTRRLLDLCGPIGLEEFHHVSTAFVCGEHPGPVLEDAPQEKPTFHNAYERSKWDAEQAVRTRLPGATVYRPSVIVGDSRTGYTSTYHGLYRFIELTDRLAEPGPRPGRRVLKLRLPFTGDEPRNLVPVDWVSGAIARVVSRPERHGLTYHLVSRTPTSARAIKEATEEVLAIDGVSLAGPGRAGNATILEDLFQSRLSEYWPYVGGDPVFDDRNTRAALPDFPPPRLERATLARLIAFAAAQRWGRRRPAGREPINCSRYLEEFFPAAVAQSSLASLPLTVSLALEVSGPGGGAWTCNWEAGQLREVRPGMVPSPEILYRLDSATLARVVRGLEAPTDAFFAKRIEILGDVEKGLKLAVLFGQFVREFPYRPEVTEVPDAHALLL